MTLNLDQLQKLAETGLIAGDDFKMLLPTDVVLELIADVRYWKKLYENKDDECESFRAENAKLREALEFYADKKMYLWGPAAGAKNRAVDFDRGLKARAALESVGEKG